MTDWFDKDVVCYIVTNPHGIWTFRGWAATEAFLSDWVHIMWEGEFTVFLESGEAFSEVTTIWRR